MYNLHVGCAGWSLPKSYASRFSSNGSHLERYASHFPAVEINSTFYQPHQPKTYERWAAAVPGQFRFAVKIPKEVTHSCRLKRAAAPLWAFIADVGHLGAKLGPLLLQLPPSLAFDPATVQDFFIALRDGFGGDVVCEPRHPTWFGSAANAMLIRNRIARVAADPAVVPNAGEPGGWDGLVYYRLHGSPRMYYSTYPQNYLEALAVRLRETKVPAWCIFDNTASGEATGNGLQLLAHLLASNLEVAS